MWIPRPEPSFNLFRISRRKNLRFQASNRPSATKIVAFICVQLGSPMLLGLQMGLLNHLEDSHQQLANPWFALRCRCRKRCRSHGNGGRLCLDFNYCIFTMELYKAKRQFLQIGTVTLSSSQDFGLLSLQPKSVDAQSGLLTSSQDRFPRCNVASKKTSLIREAFRSQRMRRARASRPVSEKALTRTWFQGFLKAILYA